MKLISPTKVEIRNSPIHGWGVFAKTVIFKGEVIEECPIYRLHGHDDWTPSLFDNYKFVYPCGTSGNNVQEFVLPLGWGAVYNHSNNPNAFWKARFDNDRVYQWVALRDIYTDEEVFTYYGDESYFESLKYNPK